MSAAAPWSLEKMGLKIPSASGLEWRSIVSAHLFYEGDAFDAKPACVIGEPFQWVFDKSRDFGLPFAYVQAVASAADPIVGLPRADVVDLAQRAINRAMPEASGRKIERAVVLRERRATFSVDCNCDAARPAAVTPIDNLFLAGDWTDTHWPATIESAVRSGRTASQAVMAKIGK